MNFPLQKMNRGLSWPIKSPAFILIGALLIVGAVPFIAGIRINYSPSLPLGLYVITKGSSNLVEFCPPEPFASLALTRGYRTSGNCDDGGAPLLKPVVAQAGDVVEFDARGVCINGNELPHSSPLVRDVRGRQLSHWRFGRFNVETGTVWVVSTYNLRSFDSRYFGPLSVKSVRHRLRPLVVLRNTE